MVAAVWVVFFSCFWVGVSEGRDDDGGCCMVMSCCGVGAEEETCGYGLYWLWVILLRVRR